MLAGIWGKNFKKQATATKVIEDHGGIILKDLNKADNETICIVGNKSKCNKNSVKFCKLKRQKVQFVTSYWLKECIDNEDKMDISKDMLLHYYDPDGSNENDDDTDNPTFLGDADPEHDIQQRMDGINPNNNNNNNKAENEQNKENTNKRNRKRRKRRKRNKPDDQDDKTNNKAEMDDEEEEEEEEEGKQQQSGDEPPKKKRKLNDAGIIEPFKPHETNPNLLPIQQKNSNKRGRDTNDNNNSAPPHKKQKTSMLHLNVI